MTTNNRIFGNTRFGPNLSHLPGIPKYRRGVTDGVTRFFSVFPVAFLGGLSAQSCADLCLQPRHSSGHRCQRPPGLPRQGGSDGWGWPSAHAPVGRGRGAGSGQQGVSGGVPSGSDRAQRPGRLPGRRPLPRCPQRPRFRRKSRTLQGPHLHRTW